MTTIAQTLIAALAAMLLPVVPHQQSATPHVRAHHALVYDAARERVLMTGGSTPMDGGQRFEFFNDLWSFDGIRWTPLPPSGDKVSGVALAYDAKRKAVLSFGGYDGNKSLGLVRQLQGDAWRTVGDVADRPAAEAGFVYDDARDRFIAFGGSAGMGQSYGATWEFDGANWKQLGIASPPARQAHVMIYDAVRKVTVLFGGMSVSQGNRPTPLDDTWEFDGARWTRLDVAGPSARMSAGATYDAKRGVILLFGGSDADGFKGDTWSFDGKRWTKLSDAGPAPRVMGYMAYDRKRDRTVLFGGRKGYPNGDLNDTWEWDGTQWRAIGGT